MGRKLILACAVAFAWTSAYAEKGEQGITPSYSPIAKTVNESGPTEPPEMKGFGIQDFFTHNLGGGAFANLSDNQWSLSSVGEHWWRSAGTNSGTCANVVLPHGALLNGITYYMFDNNSSGRMQITLEYMDWLSDTETVLFDVETGTAATPGWVRLFESLPGGDYTFIQDREGHVLCYFQWSQTGSTLGFAGATLWYHRQVSPAPGAATFGDVPTGHTFFQSVEALAASGITGGCGGGNYCPNANVTRGQMAAFLSRALGLYFPR